MNIQLNASEICHLLSVINKRKCLSDGRHDAVSFTMATLPVLMDLKQINISGNLMFIGPCIIVIVEE